MKNRNNELLLLETEKTLNPLFHLLNQIEIEEYQMGLDVLKGNSVGKHVRHIIEFYDCLWDGYEQGIINYSKRKRDLELETRPAVADIQLSRLLENISNCQNKALSLVVEYGIGDTDTEVIASNLQRELYYNLEHAIHHMAIIQIAIQSNFRHIHIGEHFGVAPSTISYQKQMAELAFEEILVQS